MAKKSKAKAKAPKSKKSKKSKIGKSKPAAKETTKVIPTYLPPGASFVLGLDDVIEALGVVDKHGNLDKLSSAAKRATTSVIFDAETVKLVKDFFVKHGMHTDPIGKHIVNPRDETATPAAATEEAVAAGSDPFKPCKFRRSR